MIPLAFRHGLRAAELCDLRWDQVASKGTTLCAIQAWLGHRSTTSTPSAPNRFKDFRRD